MSGRKCTGRRPRRAGLTLTLTPTLPNPNPYPYPKPYPNPYHNPNPNPSPSPSPNPNPNLYQACRARDTPLASRTGEREALHPAAECEPADAVHV